MCGFAGIYGGSDRAAVEAMVSSMRHRGPDDSGVYVDVRVSLGHARLSIIDLTPGGHQPMFNAAGTIGIVYNGEIYNYPEERERLIRLGESFRSTSDTEVLLALYEREGDAFLSRLRGIFAFAIYDRRDGPGRERLLLARDHFGIKPLIYAETPTGLVFASELKALLASGRVDRAVDREALRTLLTFGSVTQPHTIIEGARHLPAAHKMVVDASGCRMSPYWSFGVDRVAGLRTSPYPEIREHVRDAVIRSVEMQMIGDVTVGAFLSGGVDSSLIVALMAQNSGARIKTYSVGFETGAAAEDETEDAAEIAARLKTDHTRAVIGGEEAASHLPRFVAGIDQPSVDGMNSYFVSHWASQHVKVALSGTGGDELFAGYPWFAGMIPDFDARPHSAARQPRRFLGRLRNLLQPAEAPLDDTDYTARFLETYGGLYHCFGPMTAAALLSMSSPIAMAADLSGLDALPSADVLDRVGALCLNGYTRNQLLRDIDCTSMAASLEVRVPFLDPVIADIALSLPRDAKLRPGGTPLTPAASYDESGVKRVLIDVAREFLPQSFFSRRGKRGFNLPFGDWMRGPLRPVLDHALSPETVRRRGLFDVAVVDEIRRQFLDGHRSWNGPWLLMIIELWMQDVFDRPGPYRLPDPRPYA
ncbi:asparagine synthase (glutamine-hydrolyzing) [Rhodopseudomonas palustris]|uniref:asparagine synthase (glutamine-hydrolyzing) n=1 Tax=Rhodopseudomonas palustris TaxID=1076 RepID=UPI000E5BE2CE|nr:asparagine synthase (glutamine-hydrolyzing) [Rhodopseudomonas palustris]QLH73063.1 asparagine synthase (glutamine-hydrolyzing) [Rhodopseudomonas palustris]RHZ91223.1 asparagine synthase (glutamine-hydrolyzing) [Rhodopseudomonas palustris]